MTVDEIDTNKPVTPSQPKTGVTPIPGSTSSPGVTPIPGSSDSGQTPPISEKEQIARATADDPNTTAAYDEFVKTAKEATKTEGGEQRIGSGLHKGRPIKEDGSIDFETESDLEKKIADVKE